MGWKKTNNKVEQPNNSRTLTRDRPQSWAVSGTDVERILLQRQYSSAELTTTTERNGLQTQETTMACRVVGQILRIVGDKLDSVAKDEYEITHYGRF